MKVAAMAASMGGHVRVGFEDGIHLTDGTVARDNSDMVRAAAQIAAIYGMKPATVEEARARFRI
jgi:3-keto-5-aminohexanoate cleavage enzyme